MENSRTVDGVSEERGTDIVIPVFGAATALECCLRALRRYTPQPPHHLILVIDGPQDEKVEGVLARSLEDRGDLVTILRLDERVGFVAAVNRGMTHSERDVVLLNSDTEVSTGWLEKLQVAAYSAPAIATVTPLSNSATICSLPEFLEDNWLPAGASVEMMGEIVELVSRRDYPRLPTGVGVCLYIKRSALDAVGLFDEAKFGLGYGEENDFCGRAISKGFENISDDATFIFHQGQKSFGSEKTRLTKKAMKTLSSVDPTYIRRVASFIESDPLAGTRRRVIQELQRRLGVTVAGKANRSSSILHIVHGWPPMEPGGTEQCAHRLARQQVRRHRVSVFARVADPDRKTGQRIAYLDHGVRVRLVVNNFDRRNPIARAALKDRRLERELEAFLDATEPDLVHVHHLAGHCASLMGIVARRKIPIIYQVNDWWAPCARANLWRSDDTLCRGPNPIRCSRCLPLTGLRPRTFLNPLLHRFRSYYTKKQVWKADAYVMGSRAIRTWYSEAGLLNPRVPAHVVEYGVPVFAGHSEPRHPRNGPITFGYIGTLMPHKGAHIAVEAFRGVAPGAARLEVWGNREARPEYAAHLEEVADPGVVEFKGPFAEDSKTDVLRSFDALVVPSVGLESFGIVAREAMSAGVPVIASRRGALEELEIDGVCGAIVAPEDPIDLRAVVDRLIENPNILDEWKRALPKVVTDEQHAEEIEEIYDQLLEACR